MSKSKDKELIYVDRLLAEGIANAIIQPFTPTAPLFYSTFSEIRNGFTSVFKDNENSIPFSEFAKRVKHIKWSTEAQKGLFAKVGNLEIVLDNGEIIKTNER